MVFRRTQPARRIAFPEFGGECIGKGKPHKPFRPRESGDSCYAYVRTVFLAYMDFRLRGNDTRAKAALAIRRQLLARRFAPVTRPTANPLILRGWGTWTRTKTSGVRVRCSTIKLFPKSEGGLCASRPNQARRLSRRAGADAPRLCCNFLAAARGVRTRNHNVKRPMASRAPRAAKKSLQWRGRAP